MKIHYFHNTANPKLENFTLRSGDDTGLDITCYNCGHPFLESLEEVQSMGADLAIGDSVSCQNCHNRCAVIEQEV